MNICVRCGDEYEPYTVLVKDDFAEIVDYVSVKEEWNLHEDGNDGLCKPCRMEVSNHGYYLTESEKDEIEPKTEEMLNEG